ncbi:MAG: type II toxin-antitoxin system VapC family toxin [Gammaproteobacteria bacterium]|nr:type II toxin-antitoxin system VapC family toxin [Gammaproteobacteria bacterium]
MVLVDSSVWIDHLRQKEPQLVQLLANNRVLIHPFIIGELACGQIKNRQQFINLLSQLPAIDVAADTQVMECIEQQTLFSRGIGWVDAHLLTAVLLNNAHQLWSRDKRLHNLTVDRQLAYLE